MKNIEKGQNVRFIHPRTREECAGTVVRVDQNDRPTGWNVSIIATPDDVISVPNACIHPLTDENGSDGQNG